jgi:hypothetical protein
MLNWEGDGKFLVDPNLVVNSDLGNDEWPSNSEMEGVVGVRDCVGKNDDDLMFMGFEEVSEYLDVQIEQDPRLKEIFFVDETERVRNLIIVDKREIETHLSRFKHAKGGNLSLDRTNLVKPRNFSKTPKADHLPSETKKRKLSSWTLSAGKFQSFEGTFYDESKAGPDIGTPNFNRTINSRECCFYNLDESPEKSCLGFDGSLVENLSEIKSNKHSITDKSTILYEGPFEKNYVENTGFEFGCDSPEEDVGLANEQCSAKEKAYKNLLIRYVNKNLSMVHLWVLILLDAIVGRPTIDLAGKNLDRGSQENSNFNGKGGRSWYVNMNACRGGPGMFGEESDVKKEEKTLSLVENPRNMQLKKFMTIRGSNDDIIKLSILTTTGPKSETDDSQIGNFLREKEFWQIFIAICFIYTSNLYLLINWQLYPNSAKASDLETVYPFLIAMGGKFFF